MTPAKTLATTRQCHHGGRGASDSEAPPPLPPRDGHGKIDAAVRRRLRQWQRRGSATTRGEGQQAPPPLPRLATTTATLTTTTTDNSYDDHTLGSGAVRLIHEPPGRERSNERVSAPPGGGEIQTPSRCMQRLWLRPGTIAQDRYDATTRTG